MDTLCVHVRYNAWAMRKLRTIAACLFAFALVFFVMSPTFAAMTSTNYQILWDAAGTGGNDTSTSTSYKLRDTTGEPVVGGGMSTSYDLEAGFRAGIYDRAVNFRVLGMERSYQVAATLVSSLTVTVTTSSGYTAGGYLVLIQDEGASQISAVGRIVSTTATTILVDAWATNGTMPTIDGSDDVAYLMTTLPNIDFGTLTESDVSTAVLAWEADADVSQGYSVYLVADHEMRSTVSASTVLTAVSDGTVSAGSTEYGARSSDTSLALSTFDTADTAITTSLQQIASRGDNTLEARDFLTLKAAVANGATSAEYTQELTVLFVGDY